MGPEELDQYLVMRPMPDLRITLSSGDEIVVTEDDEPFTAMLTLVLRGDRDSKDVTRRSRLISLPNIAMVEVIEGRPRAGRRRGLR